MRGDGSVYRHKESKFWWISYWKDGKRKRESSGSEEFKVARELLNQRRAQPAITASSIKLSTPETVMIAELVEDLLGWYLSENPRPRFHVETKSRWELHLKSFFAELPASQLGTSHLRSYRARRAQEKAAFATINRELQILRKAYKLAAESEPPKVHRIPKFAGAIGKEKNARKVFIDPLLRDKLLQAASKEGLWARVFLEMALMIGWRKGELESLKVENIRTAEGTVRIEDSKNGEPREVPLPESLRILLQPLTLGREAKESLWPVKNFKYAWKHICIAAGVKSGKLDGYVIHDMRRTSTRTKLLAGVQESRIMDLQGWKTSAMVRRYGTGCQEDNLAALATEADFLERAQLRMKQAKQIEMFSTAQTPQKTSQISDRHSPVTAKTTEPN